MTLLRIILPSLAALFVAVLPATAQSSDTADGEGPRTVLDGVYTEAQAEEGADVFLAICTGCHEDIDFVDRVFHEAWADQPLYFLFKDVLTLMPDDNPGILTREEVALSLAYILRLNGYPAGDSELPTEDAPLREILWKMPPESGR